MQTTPLILALVLDHVGPHGVLKVPSVAHEKVSKLSVIRFIFL